MLHKTRNGFTFLCLIAFQSSISAQPYTALPTRDQTPLLQSYFIPASPATTQQGWSYSHALYITNTYQVDQNGSENIVIDVENTRYDFQLNYRENRWLFSINIPMMSNRRGFLDQSIVDWHDTFGLPQARQS